MFVNWIQSTQKLPKYEKYKTRDKILFQGIFLNSYFKMTLPQVGFAPSIKGELERSCNPLLTLVGIVGPTTHKQAFGGLVGGWGRCNLIPLLTTVGIVVQSNSYTVSQKWLQPKSDCKRNFFAEAFLRHPYINIYITATNIHRALFEKVCSLEADNSLLHVHY